MPSDGSAQSAWLQGVLNDARRESLLSSLMMTLALATGVCATYYTVSIVTPASSASAATVLLAMGMWGVYVAVSMLPDLVVPTANGTMAGYANSLVHGLWIALWWGQNEQKQIHCTRSQPPVRIERIISVNKSSMHHELIRLTATPLFILSPLYTCAWLLDSMHDTPLFRIIHELYHNWTPRLIGSLTAFTGIPFVIQKRLKSTPLAWTYFFCAPALLPHSFLRS